MQLQRFHKIMTVKDLKEYLGSFPEDMGITVLIANPKKRKLYPVREAGFITNMEQPLFCLQVSEEDMDAEMVAACKQDEQLEGQMEITDFPEFLP